MALRFALVVLLASVVWMGEGSLAESIRISSSSMSVIADSTSSGHAVIVYFELDGSLIGGDIHSAKMIIRPQFTQTSRRWVELNVYPVAPGVELTGNTLEGCKDSVLEIENGSHEFVDSYAENSVSIDVTHWVQCWADGKCENSGLCVVTETALAAGLSLTMSGVEANVAAIEIQFQRR